MFSKGWKWCCNDAKVLNQKKPFLCIYYDKTISSSDRRPYGYSELTLEQVKGVLDRDSAIVGTAGQNIGAGELVYFSNNTFNKEKEMKELTKPESKLEIIACEEAIQDAIDKAVAKKKVLYTQATGKLIELKDKIRGLKETIAECEEESDEIMKKIKMTAAQKKQLFGEGT